VLPPLPDRSDDVLGDLPESFRLSHVDYLPNSICWHDGSWIVSTDAWEDRRLARPDATGEWAELPTPPGWARRPMSATGADLAVLVHPGSADSGDMLARRRHGWERLAAGVEEHAVTDWDGVHLACRDEAGHASALDRSGNVVRVVAANGVQCLTAESTRLDIAIPRGATLAHLAPSPDREAAVLVVRRGTSYQTQVFSLVDGRPLSRHSVRLPVSAPPVWLDSGRVVLVAEQWPSLVPLVWDWAGGRLDQLWPRSVIGTVRSVAVAPGGACTLAVCTPWLPRSPVLLADVEAVASRKGDADVHPLVVTRGDQKLPCLVYEPAAPCRGTILYFPGGPHEPVWGEYGALAHALRERGWRIVRANVRTSGLRENAYRPRGPVRFGVDDVDDACALIDEFDDGPVVTMGMSYGGYIASLAGERQPACRAVAVLSGFVSTRDLHGGEHRGVQEFASFAFRPPPPEPATLTKRYFVAHGELDRRIPIDAVATHARRARNEFTLVPLPAVGHAIHSDHAARLTYPPLLRWLDDVA